MRIKSHLIRFFEDIIRDNSGASSAEYALLLALLGSGIAGAAFALSQTISSALQDISNTIS